MEQQAVPVAQELDGFTLGMNVRIRDGVQHFGGLAGYVEKIHEPSPRQYPIEVMLTDRKDSRCFRPHELEAFPLPCKSGEGAGAVEIPGSAWSDDWKAYGFNGAIRQAQKALRYLADNDRPSGGEEFPNSACCHMIADELEITRKRYAALSTPSEQFAKSSPDAELREISEDDLRESIRKTLEQPDMTQNLFARMHGISRGHLSEFLSGKRRAEPAIAGPCGYRWALVEDTRATDDLTDATFSPDAAGSGGEAHYLIRKGGVFYRPNAQGYTGDTAYAGRFTLDEAIRHSHPNGPDGPRDGMDYMPVPPLPDATQTREAELPAGDEELAMVLCEADGHDPHELTYHFTEPGVQEPYGDRWTHYAAQAARLRAALNGRAGA